MSDTPRTDARLMVVTDNDTCKIKVLETVRAPFVRILEREVNALTAERDQLRDEVKSCGELSCDECNARTAALTAERDQLRLDCDNETKWAAHYLAQSIADKARAERAEAEVERLRTGIAECLHINGHLADGEDCTLIGLKRCLRAIDAGMKEGVK